MSAEVRPENETLTLARVPAGLTKMVAVPVADEPETDGAGRKLEM